MSIIKTSSVLSFWDKWGSFKVRWGIGRHVYLIEPGLYSLGEPTPESPVLVTANYKLTFDIVRSQLKGLSVYLLILDTKGVNVWCAAGKGTFGTEELVARVKAVGLSDVVSHRTLVLPQLGATGVAAHEIKKQTGFKVVYGPVRAEDLPDYLTHEMKATPAMRQVRFTFIDRLKLVPVELVNYAIPALIVTGLLLLLTFICQHSLGLQDSLGIVTNIAFAYLGGVAITPLLLPWIPARSFSAKGAISGIVLVVMLQITITPWLFIIPAISSFLAMNFTGSSTYTSLSGVQKEMKIAVPIQAVSFVYGAIGLVFF